MPAWLLGIFKLEFIKKGTGWLGGKIIEFIRNRIVKRLAKELVKGSDGTFKWLRRQAREAGQKVSAAANRYIIKYGRKLGLPTDFYEKEIEPRFEAIGDAWKEGLSSDD